MSKTLIVGLPGAGKTTLVHELVHQGQTALDADNIDGLGKWYDRYGTMLPDRDPGTAHAEGEEYLWDQQTMEETLSARPNGDLYIAGVAHNFFKLIDLFDNLIYLQVSEEALLQQMATRAETETTAFGANPEEAQRACRLLPAFEEMVQLLGAVTVKGERPITEIANDVIAIGQTAQY